MFFLFKVHFPDVEKVDWVNKVQYQSKRLTSFWFSGFMINLNAFIVHENASAALKMTMAVGVDGVLNSPLLYCDLGTLRWMGWGQHTNFQLYCFISLQTKTYALSMMNNAITTVWCIEPLSIPSM